MVFSRVTGKLLRHYGNQKTIRHTERNNMKTLLRTSGVVTLLVGCALGLNCFAGQPQKWEDLPETVRAAVLANGGTAGQQVDKENGSKNGMAIYEAGVK